MYPSCHSEEVAAATNEESAFVLGAERSRFLTAVKIGKAAIEKTGVKRCRRSGVRPATAGRRFDPVSLLAASLSKYGRPLSGQQAGLSESGSKLPHHSASGSFMVSGEPEAHEISARNDR